MGAKGGLTFPLLSDASGDVSKAYGADLSIPLLGKFSDRQTFLVDKDQVVRGRWLHGVSQGPARPGLARPADSGPSGRPLLRGRPRGPGERSAGRGRCPISFF